MATRVLLHPNDAMNKCLFSILQYHRTSLQVSSSLRPVRGFKRIKRVEFEKPVVSIFTNETGPMHFRFWRTLGFALGISGVSVAGAAIWEYEKLRTRAHDLVHHIHRRRFPKTGLRAQGQAWWRNLTSGEKIFASICFLNVLVFVGWRIPALKGVMNLYFTSNPSARVVGLPMLLSTFSHYSFWHLAINMYVLHNISTPAVQTLGAEQFLAMYLISGVFGNLASHLYKVGLNQAGQSLGASGAILGVLGYTCTEFPSSELCIVFLPMFTFSAAQALKAMIAIDVAGAVMRWRVLDHAAHLGGVFTGILWQKWGNTNIWGKRKSFMMFWHKLRKSTGS